MAAAMASVLGLEGTYVLRGGCFETGNRDMVSLASIRY